MIQKRWSDEQLVKSVIVHKSYRSVLIDLGLVPAGGNYRQVQERVTYLGLDTSHFTGKGWNTNWGFDPRPKKLLLEEILVKDKRFQSYHLKKKLFKLGMKDEKCELCSWALVSSDGRIPVELDHINGDHLDNRIENLRILCPNCHSLQLTHRGKNKKIKT